ncbi:MAG: hypothetical protein IKI19_06875 [Prevotella sp.]|nr:hypothetical protein [Prevotella sp.]
MKKIFTLIAAALMAVGSSAKEALDLSSLYTNGTTIEFAGGWSWQGVTLSSGELIQNQEAGTTDDTNMTYFDASAFDYLVVKYSASTCDVNVIIQYNANGVIGQWGPEFYQGQVTAEKKAKGGVVGIKLDEHKATINSVAFQNMNDAGSITIEEAYWASTAEYEAAISDLPVETTKEIDFTTIGGYKADQGAFVFDAGSAGWYSKWIGTFDPAGWNTIVIEVASASGDVQFVMQGDKADGAQENMMILGSAEPKKYYLDLTGWTNISQFAFQNFFFSDPDNADWDAKQASAQENIMVVTAMYYSKEEKPAEEVNTQTIFLWEGAEEGATCVGGSVVGYGADESSVNAANKGYYTLKVSSKKANIETDNITITLDEALEANDQIAITAYRNKDTDANGTLYILFENGTVIDQGDEVVWNNVHDDYAQQPNTITYPAGDAAGSKTIKLARSKASTNVFITKFLITRQGAIEDSINGVKAITITSDVLYNLRGQKVDATYKGIVVKNGRKYMQN